MATIEQIREERRKVNAEIEALRSKALILSDMLLEAEGPIPDRSGRTSRLGYRIVKP